MDTNKKILIGAIGAAVVIGGVAIGSCSARRRKRQTCPPYIQRQPRKLPRKRFRRHTAPETGETTEGQEDAASSVSASIETYTSGKVSIQYPAVDQMDDTSKKDKINELLKTNALSFIKANDIDESNDTLDIKCKVISVDRKRLTATYTGTLSAKGAAHPVNLFYSNTVNLLQAQNLGLDDFTDAYTMAGYVLSDDVKFSGISSDVEAQVLSYRSSMDLDSLTAVFNSADFPLSSETQWPESFSYEKQGRIYFSLPIPHALGDYVIVEFDPATK